MRSGTTAITYLYGADGMRARKTVEASGTTATVTESVWSAGQLIAERDSDGTLIKYLYGPGGIPLQIRVTRTVGGTATTSKYFYQLDHAGSVVALTDEWGSAVARYAYDPWGRPVPDISGTDEWLQARQPLRYRGYCWDAETGMYYLPARYYDPALARFISPDPAPPAAGGALSLNAYIYCADDPVNKADPTGEAWGWFASAVRAVARAVSTAFSVVRRAFKRATSAVASAGRSVVSAATKAAGSRSPAVAYAREGPTRSKVRSCHDSAGSSPAGRARDPAAEGAPSVAWMGPLEPQTEMVLDSTSWKITMPSSSVDYVVLGAGVLLDIATFSGATSISYPTSAAVDFLFGGTDTYVGHLERLNTRGDLAVVAFSALVPGGSTLVAGAYLGEGLNQALGTTAAWLFVYPEPVRDPVRSCH